MSWYVYIYSTFNNVVSKGVKKNQIRLELCKKRGLVFEINVFFYFWRVFRHNVGVHIVYNFVRNQVVPYNNDSTASRLLSEVKHCLARLVLRWGTTLESREYYLLLKILGKFMSSKLCLGMYIYIIYM